jgi:hypothetical protein
MRKILINLILVLVLIGGAIFLGDYVFQKYSQYNNDRLSKQKSEQLEKEKVEKETYLKKIKEGLLVAKNKGETADMGTLQLTMLDVKILDEYTDEPSILYPNPETKYVVGILMKAYNSSDKDNVSFRRTIDWISSSSEANTNYNVVSNNRDKYFSQLGQEPYSTRSDITILPKETLNNWILVEFDKDLKDIQYLYPHTLYSSDDLIAGFNLEI